MRTIKFRAWDGVDKKMVGVNSLDWKQPSGLEVNDTNVSLPETLMQFTGLLDKNGKEIYENDVVKYKNLMGCECERDEWQNSESATVETKVIEFRDGEFYPREKFYECDDCFYDVRHFDFEVVGNIYENPELIK